MALFSKTAAPDDLDKLVATEALADAQAQIDEARKALPLLSRSAEELAVRLSALEAGWQAAAKHSQYDADRLRQTREEVSAAYGKVAEVEAQIAALEAQIDALSSRAAIEGYKRRAQLVEEVWRPACETMVPLVRELLSALQSQHKAWNVLLDEQAWGIAPDNTHLIGLDSTEYSDGLLEHWLAAMVKAGWAKPTKAK